jgi:bifunctional non-homologous end joining protein LigD
VKRARSPQPEWITPMRATLAHQVFSHEGWIFEPKFDGERCLAFREGRRLRMLSRNMKPLNETYPEIAEALAAERAESFIVDGEVVAFDERGISSFSRLQRRIQIRDARAALGAGVPVCYYVFDLLYLHGEDLTGLPLRRRKEFLARALEFRDPVRLVTYRETEGERYFEEACRNGWEGLIAKRFDSVYEAGRRSREWLKLKCVNQREFVIGGYTDPHGGRLGFGALLVGYYEGGRLKYAGKVGTGFDDAALKQLHRRMAGFETAARPFDSSEGLPGRGVHWVQPRLVAEIGFTEWTRDGKLRHPRFIGLRDDKAPGEVTRDT